ncbi:hypothetical protein B0I73DRAFT_101562 [Yarrowia lipolytica]|nr:hypothetical protein B0I73DRAFT_101562 [Yarrowia lipolytica]RDW45429.1 hypothetical protein B0I74DRAFT_113603 [Yarrowia lipolytica]RDW52032.1 hypothetical protein B0I75DRAFT_119694 [Yarrowia lipolytica]
MMRKVTGALRSGKTFSSRHRSGPYVTQPSSKTKSASPKSASQEPDPVASSSKDPATPVKKRASPRKIALPSSLPTGFVDESLQKRMDEISVKNKGVSASTELPSRERVPVASPSKIPAPPIKKRATPRKIALPSSLPTGFVDESLQKRMDEISVKNKGVSASTELFSQERVPVASPSKIPAPPMKKRATPRMIALPSSLPTGFVDESLQKRMDEISVKNKGAIASPKSASQEPDPVASSSKDPATPVKKRATPRQIVLSSSFPRLLASGHADEVKQKRMDMLTADARRLTSASPAPEQSLSESPHTLPVSEAPTASKRHQSDDDAPEPSPKRPKVCASGKDPEEERVDNQAPDSLGSVLDEDHASRSLGGTTTGTAANISSQSTVDSLLEVSSQPPDEEEGQISDEEMNTTESIERHTPLSDDDSDIVYSREGARALHQDTDEEEEEEEGEKEKEKENEDEENGREEEEDHGELDIAFSCVHPLDRSDSYYPISLHVEGQEFLDVLISKGTTYMKLIERLGERFPGVELRSMHIFFYNDLEDTHERAGAYQRNATLHSSGIHAYRAPVGTNSCTNVWLHSQTNGG